VPPGRPRACFPFFFSFFTLKGSATHCGPPSPPESPSSNPIGVFPFERWARLWLFFLFFFFSFFRSRYLWPKRPSVFPRGGLFFWLATGPSFYPRQDFPGVSRFAEAPPPPCLTNCFFPISRGRVARPLTGLPLGQCPRPDTTGCRSVPVNPHARSPVLFLSPSLMAGAAHGEAWWLFPLVSFREPPLGDPSIPT